MRASRIHLSKHNTFTLPGWTTNRLAYGALFYRDMDPKIKSNIMTVLAKDGIKVLSTRADIEKVYQVKHAPLPASSQQIFSSLRQSFEKKKEQQREFSTQNYSVSSIPSPPEAAEIIGVQFDAVGIPYAIGGAIAYGFWGIPRTTLDVDMNLFVEPSELPGAFDVLEKIGFHFDRQISMKKAINDGMFQAIWGKPPRSFLKLDVFTPSIEFSMEAKRTRVKKPIGDSEVWVLSAEAICIFKLLFFRTKDCADIEAILQVQGEQLNCEYVRLQITGMMGEDSDRVQWWNKAVAEFIKT